MKKKIGIILIVIIVVVGLGCGYFFMRQKNGSFGIKKKASALSYGVTSVVSLDYAEIYDYYEDLFLVYSEDKYGLVNAQNEVVVDIVYDSGIMHQGYFRFTDEDNYYIYDGEGKLLKKSANELDVITDTYNGDIYFYERSSDTKYTIYDEHFQALLTDSVSVYDHYFTIGNGNLIWPNKLIILSSGEKIKFSEAKIKSSYLIFETDKGYQVFDLVRQTLAGTYEEVIWAQDSVRLINEDEKAIIFADEKKIITYTDEENIPYKTDYYLDISGCTTGGALKNKKGKVLVEGCFDSYKISETSDKIIAALSSEGNYLYVDEEKYAVRNFEFYEDFVTYTNENGILNILDTKGKTIENKTCSSLLSAGEDLYCYVDGNYYAYNDFSRTDKFNEIEACKGDLCIVVNESNKYGLYQNGEYLIEAKNDYLAFVGYAVAITNGNKTDIVTYGNTEKKAIIAYEPKENQIALASDEELEQIIADRGLKKIKNKILEKKDFYKKYITAVKENENLEDYQKYFYDIWVILVKIQSYINETKLLEDLKTLSIEFVNDFDGNNYAGLYESYPNKISILRSLSASSIDEVIYHEVLHFIDFKLNTRDYYDTYLCEEKYYVGSEVLALKQEKRNQCQLDTSVQIARSQFFTETNAEVLSSKHFDNGLYTSYYDVSSIASALIYIVGEEMYFEFVYAQDGYKEFFDLVTDLGYDYFDLRQNLDLLVTEYNEQALLMVSDFLVDLYKKHNDEGPWEDETFNLLLSTIVPYGHITKKNTDYYDYYTEVYNDYWEYDKLVQEKGYYLYGLFSPSIHISEDEYSLSFYASVNAKCGSIKLTYDLKNNKYKTYDYVARTCDNY